MTESAPAPKESHDARITDRCYGMTGGVRIDCRCGYVVLPQRDVDHETVVAYHNRHRQVARGAGAEGGDVERQSDTVPDVPGRALRDVRGHGGDARRTSRWARTSPRRLRCGMR